MRIVSMGGGGLGGTVDMLPIARRMGASAVLHKPFSPSALLEALEGRPAV